MTDLPPTSPLRLLDAPDIDAALKSGAFAEAEARIATFDPGRVPIDPGLIDAALGYARAQIRVRRLESEAAARALGALADRFQALGRPAAAAHCLGEQALCLALSHRADEAQQRLLLADEILALLPDAERLPVQALCQLAVGWTLLGRGALVEALGVFERAHEGARRPESGAAPGAALVVSCLLGMGQALRLLCLGERAAACLGEAARQARAGADPFSEGIALGQLALCALGEGDFEAGHRYALRQVSLARSLGDGPGESRGLVILGEALLQLGRAEEARQAALRGLRGASGPCQTPLQRVYAALVAARAVLGVAGKPRPEALAETEALLAEADELLAGRDLGPARLLHRACLCLLQGHRGDLGAMRAADADARAAMRRVPVPGAMADAFGLLARAFLVSKSPLHAAARERRAQLCWELLAEPRHKLLPPHGDDGERRSGPGPLLGASRAPGRPAGREPSLPPGPPGPGASLSALGGVTLLGPLGRAAKRTLQLRALTYDDEPRPAVLVLLRSLPAQREALLRTAAELGCASAGQIGPLLGLVLEPPEDDGPDGRLMALRSLGEILGERAAPIRGVLTDVGEVVLDSAAWPQLLGAA